MDKYFEFQNKYKLGSTIEGEIINLEEIGYEEKYLNGSIILNCDSNIKGYLPYNFLFDDIGDFKESEIPEIGTRMDLIIVNWREDGLILSNKTNDRTLEATRFKKYYELIKNELILGDERIGRVKEVKAFGIFVDFGYDFFGLIDIGHIDWNKGTQLPYNSENWPKVGEEINCKISYYRYWDRQIGLGWLPNK